MREERKLHHAVESSGGERWGEESCRGEETAEERWRRAREERKLHHAVEIGGEQQRSEMESCR